MEKVLRLLTDAESAGKSGGFPPTLSCGNSASRTDEDAGTWSVVTTVGHHR
jgi:hypothetical protein